ncbi:MAG: ArsC family reductase [Rhodocyclaceae bacterium]
MSATDITVYGIKNCDTMKKAFNWLDEHRVTYTFHDYKRSGIDTATLSRWCERLGWEALVNTRGTTWRKLDAQAREIGSTAQAIALMQTHTSLIRRPVVELTGGGLLVGFDPAAYSTQWRPESAPTPAAADGDPA